MEFRDLAKAVSEKPEAISKQDGHVDNFTFFKEVYLGWNEEKLEGKTG